MRRYTGEMIRILTRLLAPLAALLALVAPPAVARNAHHSAHATAPIAAHPALWVVHRATAGGQSTVYLFGTVHLMTKDADWFEGPVAQGFGAADTLVTEVIDKDPAEMRELLQTRALLPEGQSLRASLSTKDRVAYEKTMVANALPAASFDRYRPWFAAISLVNVPLMRAGFDPATGFDAILGDKADAAHKSREALETSAFQFGLFADLPEPAQKRYLREVVDNMPSLQRDMAKVMVTWKAGEVARLARLVNTESDDPQLRATLLINRNKAWAQWIKARLDTPGIVFVAVGAGHLAGPGSVQDQLKALGIDATRLQ